MNKKDVKLILKEKLNLTPKKHLGQHFLIKQGTAEKILNLSEISKDDVVLEVGAGLGALTEHLINKAKKVYAYEIDPHLFGFLKDKFSEAPHLNLRNQDILESELPYHDKVVSNPPYSITGPLMEKLFFNATPPVGILLIEYQLAKRIFSKGEYKDFSRLSVTVNSFVEPVKKMKISQNAFYPRPQIKLTLIKVKPKEEIHSFLKTPETRQFFLDFIKGIFPYKNKNLPNAVELFLKRLDVSNIEKSAINSHLEQNKIQIKKVFDYQIEEYPDIAKIIFDLIRNSKK
jgi:16S rRNA (adenine1518-N6/adenine1519-N6)-dimethyltransferase